MSAGLKTVTVRHASFWYARRYPGEDVDRQAVALRGEEIQVGKDDYDRGKRFGAFATKDEPLEPVTPALEPPPEPVEVDLGQSVDKILEAVGEDPVLAAAVLEQENAAETPRKTLVEPLQALVDASNGTGDPV